MNSNQASNLSLIIRYSALMEWGGWGRHNCKVVHSNREHHILDIRNCVKQSILLCRKDRKYLKRGPVNLSTIFAIVLWKRREKLAHYRLSFRTNKLERFLSLLKFHQGIFAPKTFIT